MGISKGCVSEPRGHCTRNLPGPKANILINQDGRACLADFGLFTIASDRETFILSWIEGGMIQWISPELIDPDLFNLTDSRPTKESDCYALGMVIYEVLSGQTPFAPSKLPLVVSKVLRGQRPERPQENGRILFTDDLWKTLQRCWKHKPDERTDAKVVLRCLERTSLLPRPHFDTEEIVETGAGEQIDTTAGGSGMFSPFRRRPQADIRSSLWCNRSVGH